MSILSLQQRLHEAGRIRIGMKVPITSGPNAGKDRPIKLDRFRFTSQSQRAIEAVAQLCGGSVEKWDDAPDGDQWEVVTEAKEVDVVVLPATMSFEQNMELWSGGGCQRRCNGLKESITGRDCICDPDNTACKPHTYLSLMLARIPGIGMWRISTKGWYAATELKGSMEMAAILTSAVNRSILPGKLRIEAKSVKRADKNGELKTMRFPVPVLDFDVDMAALAVGASPIATLSPVNNVPALESVADERGLPAGAADEDHPDSPPSPESSAAPAGLTPIPASDEPVPTVAEQLAAVQDQAPAPRRANSAPPLPKTGLAPRTAIDAVATEVAQPSPAADDPDTTRAAAVDKAKATAETKTEGPRTPAARGRAAAKPKVERSKYLPNMQPRLVQSQLTLIQTLFSKEPSYKDATREERLLFVRNLLNRDDIDTTWDLSIDEGSKLIEHLKVLIGDEPPLRDEDGQ